MAAAGAEVLVRLLSIPILALAVLGFGGAEHTHAGNFAAPAAETTLRAGSARFVASFSRSETGVINFRDETAVLDNGAIFGATYLYWPLSSRESAVLGIPAKRWRADKISSGYDLVDDPFLTGTRALLKVIGRAERVREVGPGIERGTPVQRYSAKIPLDAFLSELPPFEKKVTKPGDPGPASWRDYLVNYMGADPSGQNLNLAVDSHGRIRTARLDLYEPVTVEFYDYGVRVDTSAPPANEVISSIAYEQLKSDYCSSPRRQTLPRPYPCP
jgi:hypothetical protein